VGSDGPPAFRTDDAKPRITSENGLNAKKGGQPPTSVDDHKPVGPLNGSAPGSGSRRRTIW
jgi:hypothetical protein